MTGATHHRARRMATRAARIESRYRRCVRHASIKPESIVDMVDMSVPNTEMPLDLWWRQSERIDHTACKTRRKLLRDIKKMLDITGLLLIPGSLLKFIRDPLHEERRVVPFLVVLQGGIRLGVDVPLDCWKIREASRLHVFIGFPNRSDDISVLRK